MKVTKQILGFTFVAAQLLFAQSVLAQSWSFENVNAQIGNTEVVVPWSFQAGGGVQGIGVDVVFDNTLISPQVTGAIVDGCFESVTAQVPPSCQLINPTTIRITISNFPGTELVSANGIITFDIDATAAVDDSSDLELTVASVVPQGSNVALTNGSVTIVSGPQPSLVFDPVSTTELAFGGVENGQTVVDSVDICNGPEGETGSVISAISASAPTAEFVVDDSDCDGRELPPGQCCTVEVAFTPSAGDSTAFSDTLAISTSAGPGTFPLSGTGEDGPAGALSIDPTAFDFGELLTGVETATTTFTVESSGQPGSTVTLNTVGFGVMMLGLPQTFEVTGGDCQALTVLAQGSSCTVEVTFAPTVDGPTGATLVVEGTDTINDSPVSVSASLTGEGVTRAIFSSDPAPGDVDLGFAGAEGELSLDVTVFNDGNGDMTFECTETADPGNVFTFDPLSLNIEGDETGSFNVSCSLPDLDTYSATLSCDTNDPDNGDVEYTFTCSGLEPLAVPTMSNWSIALFALLMLLVGGFSIRFFRT
ncbi:MAG: IPTL-CTERM sorting domain-containing protein [Wenzhouxiangella sp.]|jgi:hypothetical protein|nr:IPTL-CTERM sorting domain-containing protein [Wenzhouxiangella sp.]